MAEIIERYNILGEIGRGAMGVVYCAEDTHLARKVALKELLINPALSDNQKQELIERFYREARAAGRLSHPNIVQIFDVFKHKERFFISMECLDGKSLREILESDEQISLNETVNIMQGICDGLNYAHQQGIVHRDVKPDNIIILKDGRVKITDFGIAKIITDSTMTQTGTAIGTPSYMSPEQVEGKKADHRADIWATGVMLFELLTGKKPFEADTITGVMYKIVHQELEFPKDLQIPSYLEGIIQNALAKDISQRYQSIATLAEDLKSKITPEPTVNKRIEPTVLASPSRPQKSKYITIGIPAGVGLLLLTIMIFALSSLLTKPERKELKSSPPPVVAQKSVRVEPDVIGQDVKNPALFSKADEEEKIRRVLNRWIETIEEGNISEHMSYYADLVGTYFTKHNLTNSRIYRDKVNAFSKYDTFDMDIRDINIDVVSEDFAIAIFDKRWDARGPGRKFAGDERQRLKLRKYGDNWKIFSEEELEVYWVER